MRARVEFCTHLHGPFAGEQWVQLRRRGLIVARVWQVRAGHERRVLDELVLEAHILVVQHVDARALREQLLEYHAERERDRHILEDESYSYEHRLYIFK